MAFDEMFDAQGNVRGPYKGIYAELAPSDASDLRARAEALARAQPQVIHFLEGLSVRKVIVVPGKIVNIVAG